jgi:hypothetical protein
MWTIIALIALALAFCWLAMRFREVGPLTEELQKTRAENLVLQGELRHTRRELEATRVALKSFQTAIENH